MASAVHGTSNRSVLLIAVTLGAMYWVLSIGWLCVLYPHCSDGSRVDDGIFF